MAFASRTAIIAGGLGGLGSATGRLLRSQGARLAILYPPFEGPKRRQLLEESYGDLDRGDVSAHECDITSVSSVSKAFAGLSEEDSRASILAICSGYVSICPAEETSTEEVLKNLHINVLGPTLLSQAFAKMYWSKVRGMAKDSAPPGRIVSIASQAAHVALTDHAAYCASKAALLGLTRCLANEWGPRGITANTVSPTVVMTGLGKIAWADRAVREAFQEQIPTRRFAEPEEIAEATAFLCRDDSGMINGADIRVDGGFTIR